MAAGVTGWIFFIMFLVSTPVYMLILYVMIRYRRKAPFCTSFFTISLSIGAFDMLHLIPGWLTGRFANFGWFGVDQLVMQQPAFWAKFESMMWWFAGLGQTLGVLLLAAARMLTISFRYELTAVQMRLLLLAHWALPALITLPQLWLDFDYVSVGNDTDGVLMYWQQIVYQDYYFTGCIYWCAVLALGSAVCFWLAFRTIYYNRLLIAPLLDKAQKAASPTATKATEIKLALVGFVLFVLTAIYAVYCGVNAEVTGPQARMMMLELGYVLGDIYSWINAYLLLACSRATRRHCAAVLMCRANASINATTIAPKSRVIIVRPQQEKVIPNVKTTAF